MNYYNDLEIPYWNLIQIRKKDDLRYLFELKSYLDLSKVKTDERHLKAFSNIMELYNDELLKREKAATLFELEKEIAQLQAERHICLLCMSQIKIFGKSDGYKEVIDHAIEELDNLGYSYNGSVEALEGQIDSILNDIDDLELLKNQSSGKGTEQTTESMINAIEKYRKVALNIKEISTAQYLEYENDYINYVIQLKNKK